MTSNKWGGHRDGAGHPFGEKTQLHIRTTNVLNKTSTRKWFNGELGRRVIRKGFFEKLQNKTIEKVFKSAAQEFTNDSKHKSLKPEHVH